MLLTRRKAAAAAIALTALSFSAPLAFGQSGDEAAVTQAGEALRQAMLSADKAKLEQLTSDQLSYGHSAGRLETKAQFIDVVANKKTAYKSIAMQEPSTAVVGNNAIVRHIFVAETEADGKASSARVGVLQVWVKQDGSWKLLARQAYRL